MPLPLAPPFNLALAAIDSAHSEDPNLITTNPSTTDTTTTTATDTSNPTPTVMPYELHYAQKCSHYLHLHTPHASPLLQLAIRAQHLRRWEVPRSSYPMNRAGYLTWRTALKNRQAKLVEEICRSVGVAEEECRLVAALVRKEGLGRVSSIPPHPSSAAAAAAAAVNTTTAASNTATITTTTNNNSPVNDHHHIWSQGEGEGDGSSYSHPDVQILEDVACLVFLDDQFEEFEKRFVMGAATKAKDEQNEQGKEDDQQQQQREEKVIGILKKTWAKMSPRGHELALQIHMSDRTKNLVTKALEHAN